MANPSTNASTVHLHLPVLAASGEPHTSCDAPCDDTAPTSQSVTDAHLSRFAQCPLSFQLHYVDRLPADIAPERHFGLVVHRALEATIRDHVRAGRTGTLDPELAATAYRAAWTHSELRDHALFGEGLALVQRWVAREGVVDPARVLGVERRFEFRIGTIRVRGTLDRADRIGGDAVRIRDYKTSRLPPSRRDAEESLQLALYDLAARELWPWAKRVEVAFDLLRHDVTVAVERTEAQREATRRYVDATVAQIEAAAYPAHPSTACAHCDHRSQCPAYADARAGKRTVVGAEADDLPAVAREREEVATLLRALGERKDTLDEILRAALGQKDELRLEGRRYSLVTAMRRDYPLRETLRALEGVGVAREAALARLGAVDGGELKALLAELARTVPRLELLALRTVLDAQARCSPVARLTVREVRS